MMKPLAISDEMWMNFKSQLNPTEETSLTDDIYDALTKDDLSESVMAILKKIKKLTFKKVEKSESKSIAFRIKGNKDFVARKFQDALVCYNQALLYAPPQSLLLKLAYSNRSAVFLQAKCAAACIKDIDTCFRLGCPDNLKDKLIKRRLEAVSMLQQQELASLMEEDDFADQFFKICKRNSQIPCCSSNVKVIIRNNQPKIIASKYIEAGTVLAVETAFISETELDNIYYSCHHCQKMALNLIPCKGCTFALFCDDHCEKMALREYHKIECAIGEIDLPKAYNKMFFKAAIKIRNSCSSWEEFIEASNIMGQNRITTSTIKEIHDEREKFSMLNFLDNRPIVEGPRTSLSFLVAMLIYDLKNVPFFPTNHLETHAIEAFARVLMYLYLYLPKTQKLPSVASVDGYEVLHRNTNFGVFSFISKITNACPGNCITIDLNKKQALVAMIPIAAGTELTVPFFDPWIQMSPLDMYSLYNTVGGCNVCKGQGSPPNIKYNKRQEKALFQHMMIGIQTADEFNSSNVEEIFRVACDNMPLFISVPHTDEHKLVYGTFRKCLLYLQDKISKNIVLDLVQK